jgi:hypothetical protein
MEDSFLYVQVSIANELASPLRAEIELLGGIKCCFGVKD